MSLVVVLLIIAAVVLFIIRYPHDYVTVEFKVTNIKNSDKTLSRPFKL